MVQICDGRVGGNSGPVLLGDTSLVIWTAVPREGVAPRQREPDRAKHKETAPGQGSPLLPSYSERHVSWGELPSSGASRHLLPEGEGLALTLSLI